MLLNNKIFRLTFPVFFVMIMVSCNSKPVPIKMGDACTFCKMGVADNRFGAEMITKKGKTYKFDDIHCLLGFIKENSVPKDQEKSILFVDFNAPHDFIESENVYLLNSENLRSPMGGNIAAFTSEATLKQSQDKLGGEVVKWSSLDSK